MSHPREILSRIQRRQAHRDALRSLGAPRVPAPAPAGGLSPVTPIPTTASTSASSMPIPSPTPAPAMPASLPAPMPAPAPIQPPVRPAPGHALYSELMRSHDRMGTRHIKP